MKFPAQPGMATLHRFLLIAVLLLLLAWLLSSLWQLLRDMPDGFSVTGPWHPALNARVLLDQTHQNAAGEPISQQQIFDEALSMIAQAQKLVVADLFLFNDFAGQHSFRSLSAELTQALIRARERNTELEVVLITDPFNTLYGGVRNAQLEALERAGVKVIVTPVEQLPASNPIGSGLWALCCAGLGNSSVGGWLPNPVGSGKVTLRTYLNLINFRANHRKTLVVDQGDDWAALITSANPHDASSRHSNQALRFEGAAALDLLKTEQAVVHLAGHDARHWPQPKAAQPLTEDQPRLRILSEGAIRDALLETVASAGSGDRLDMEVFYLSFRPLVDTLIQAKARGVQIRLLLDSNRDAFGREKNGIPNRQVAWDLHQADIEVRWCATHGEQCHRKWVLLQRQDGRSELLSGSANFTRRNLDDLNLETNVQLLAQHENAAIITAAQHFERSWSNPDGITYSLPYSTFADHSHSRYWLYRLMEASGLSTF